MKSLYDFIVKPIGDKYTNTIKVGDKNVIVNTKIENWKFVNRLAQVIETPLAFKSGIKKGDIVVIHQNLILKMICISVALTRFIYIKIKKVGTLLVTDVL